MVRLDALGDTLLSTPAIEHLQERVGAENLLILVSPGMGEVFGEVIPHVEVAPSLTEPEIAALVDDFGADIVFVFSEKKRALRAAHLSKASQKIGFDPGWSQPIRSLEVKRFLTMRFPIINSLDSNSRYHEVERYCRLVGKGLSHKFINGAGLRLFPWGPAGTRGQQPTVIGFQWTKKWLQGGWSEEILLKILQTLPEDTTIFVAPAEKDWAESLLPESRRERLSCCPTLLGYAQEIAKCRYLLTIDTGAVHIASAVGTPVVDVFPEEKAQHTVPRWRPWMIPHQVVLKPSNSQEEAELLRRIAVAVERLEKVLEWKQGLHLSQR